MQSVVKSILSKTSSLRKKLTGDYSPLMESIRVAWKEDLFFVVRKTGRDMGPEEDECIIIRQFDDPKEAMKYAAALMDGVKLAKGEPFTHTDWFHEVMATPEALAAMQGMVMEQYNSERS